ncbi:MAG: hypothetical protein ACRDTV_09870 [Mycobacterium sp.]
MALDGLLTEAGRALSAARRLFGATPSEESLPSAQQLADGRDALAQLRQAAASSWQGRSESTYLEANDDQVQALDGTLAADSRVGPTLDKAAQAATAGAKDMDKLIAQTRSGVAKLASGTRSAGGQQALARYLEGQLTQAKGVLQNFAQRDAELAGTIQAADYRTSTHGNKQAPPAAPLDSHPWKPGDKRHRPYIAGPGGLGPPNPADGPRWLEIGPRSGNFVRSDELPGVKVAAPGALGPAPFYDKSGNEIPYIELGPNTGVWVPQSDFPGAKFYPPGSTALPPYGWEEYLPGSGIFLWHGDLLPETLNPQQPPGC